MTRIVWLASYPKSGNTWFRMLVANLSAKDVPADINDPADRVTMASARGAFDDTLLIDSALLTHDEADCLRPRLYEELARGPENGEDAEQQPVRFVKTHDAYTLTPKGEPLLAGRRGAEGAIVIVRDPRDVAPSLANHNRSSIDEAIAFMNNANAAFCSATNRQQIQLRQKLPRWSGHAASWLDQTDVPVHLVRYEEMQADPAGTLARALAFAGYEAAGDDIARAVAFADFAQLRAQEQEKGFREAPPGLSQDSGFFRRGKAGGWRDELTPEQAARIEADHAPMMRRLGYAPAAVAPANLACAG